MMKQWESQSKLAQSQAQNDSMYDEQLYRRKKRPWYQRHLQYYRWRLMRLRERPEKLAKGFAVGTFAGCFPFFGLQMVMAIVLAIIIRGNKLAAMMGTWISNPFTYVPIFWFNFEVGQLILHLGISDFQPSQIEFNWHSWQSLANAGLEIIFTLLVGSFAVGVVIGCLFYYLILIILKNKNYR
jgi:uncharacterized protein (DUF2062 family)